MDSKKVIEVLKQVRNKKRNFSQAIDLVISLKDLDLKKPDNQIDFFITFQNNPGKKAKIAALVAQELAAEAKNVCDTVVLQDEFPTFVKDKKALKKLVKEHTYFIGQADIMPKVAATFGRILGPHGKMPNPKAGCIVPPKSSLKPLYDKLQKTVRVQAKTAPVVQCRLGNEKMSNDELAQNFKAVYDQLVASLPNGEANIKDAFLKVTMGKPVRLLAKRGEGKSKTSVRTE